MTITNTEVRKEYTGNASTTTYPFPGTVYAASDIVVHVDGSLQTQGVHYDVVGTFPGPASVVFKAAYIPAMNASVIIECNIPETQMTDLPAAGRYTEANVEQMADKATRLIHQLKGRSVLLPLGSPVAGPLQLPPLQALKFLRVNPAGTGLELVTASQADIVGILDDTVPSCTFAGLPPAGTSGRLRRLTDDDQGLWFDNGLSWLPTGGPCFDLRRFGAKGDGVTDDSEAVANAFAAIKAAKGGTLSVPGKVYRINNKITLDEMPQTFVVGVGGRDSSISTQGEDLSVSCFLNGTGGDSMFEILGTTTPGRVITGNFFWRHVAFDNRLHASNVGVVVNSGYDRKLWQDCSFFGGLSGIKFTGEGAFNQLISRCFFSNISYAIDIEAGTSSLNAMFEKNIFRNGCGTAVRAYDGTMFFRNNMAEGCVGIAYNFQGIANLFVDGDHFEQNSNYNILVQPQAGRFARHIVIKNSSHYKNIAGGQTVCVRLEEGLRTTIKNNDFQGPGSGHDDLQINHAQGGHLVDVSMNSFDNGYSAVGVTEMGNQNFGWWTPNFAGLTVVNGTGGATYSGQWWREGAVIHWFAKIAVTGNCTTASAEGSTYINNLPFTPYSAVWQAVDVVDQGSLNGGAGGIIGKGWVRGGGVNQVHMPTWSARNCNITIHGATIINNNI